MVGTYKNHFDISIMIVFEISVFEVQLYVLRDEIQWDPEDFASFNKQIYQGWLSFASQHVPVLSAENDLKLTEKRYIQCCKVYKGKDIHWSARLTST